jgi:ubiquinone/menaquinone biosynthesis C-methylase UbiE
MIRTQDIREAYRMTGEKHDFYDGMITCSSLTGKVICRMIWGMGPRENDRYIEQALAGIPPSFDGALLEVPVGTGVLTMPLYRHLPEADITCLDHSPDMMRRAEERARAHDLDRIRFVQGDVAHLPFEDASFDAVLSLNGFHAFPDKDAAYEEIHRVLKPNGTFCGCFYIQGEDRRTDWIVRHLYVPRGFFTPPFETRASLTEHLSAMYDHVRITTVRSMASFVCTKRGGHA